MRIRKRQVPFPLSSLSPMTLSDPHPINRSPVVQLDDAAIATPPKSSTPLPQHPTSTNTSDHHQPSDQPLPPIGSDFSYSGVASRSGVRVHQQLAKEEDCLVDEDWRGQEGTREKGNDTSKGGILGSETPAEVLPPSSPSNQDGRWCEGEKAIPLKKRRGTFERVGHDMAENNNNNNGHKKMKTRMKTKMNRKCSMTQNDNEQDDDDEEEIEETKPDVNVTKKRARGGSLMEGSRCSRVNGRGWRCCQQTLVGYSLCEHHLGKGRLRSMTSVRSRSVIAGTTTAPKKNGSESDPLSGASSSSTEKKTKCEPLGNNDGEHKYEKKPVIITKKRMKLGMVKARSISSLLGQTNTEVAVAENNK